MGKHDARLLAPVAEVKAAPRRSPFATVLRVTVSGALVAWILSRTDLTEVGAAFRSADLQWIAASILLNPLGYVMSVRRWRLLLAAQGARVPFSFLLKSFLVGVFFNNLLPSTIGGDAVRAWDTARVGLPRARALGVVVIDRFLGLLTLTLFAAAGVLVSPGLAARAPALYAWVLAGAAAAVAIAWLLFVPSARMAGLLAAVRDRLPGPWPLRFERVRAALLAFQGQRRALAAALAYSAGLQAAVVANGYCLARALHVEVPLGHYFVLVPVAVLAMMLPVSINAIGVRENVWAFLLAPFGVASATAVAVAWLDYGLVLLQALIGGVVYAMARRDPGQGWAERPGGREPAPGGPFSGRTPDAPPAVDPPMRARLRLVR